MADYTVSFYDADPDKIFSNKVGDTSVYNGPARTFGEAVITDNGLSTAGQSLEHKDKGEDAVASISIGDITEENILVYAERSWTLYDTVTGETFEMVRFRVKDGSHTGDYTLSERELVAGRTYETRAYSSKPDAEVGDPVFTYDDYLPETDLVVSGTDGDDVIDANYTGDPHGDRVDFDDGEGTRDLEGASVNWSAFGDEANLKFGGSQDTGNVTVSMTYQDADTDEEFSTETSGGSQSIYVAPGETFDPNSAAFLRANGSNNETTITVNFAASAGANFEDTVANVRFRISDIDGTSNDTNNFLDIVTIRAYDANGNVLPVEITAGSALTVTGDTIRGSYTNTTPGSADGSALIEIAGPVSRFEVIYENGGNTQQAIYFSDVEFDAIRDDGNDDVIEAGAGNDYVDAGVGYDYVDGGTGDDTLHGGEGRDTLVGGQGNDLIFGGGGDSLDGGEGDDLFRIDGTKLTGEDITIVGGEGGETFGDRLDFNGQLLAGSVIYSDTDPGTGRSGTATLKDGSTVRFSEIESVVCFTSGALIETPYGSRPVQDLRPGDTVLTRDEGPQTIRWAGRRSVAGNDKFAPIVFEPGSIGNPKRFAVSPQHRMLIEDYRAQLYFGEEEVLVAAAHLVNGTDIKQLTRSRVCYHHIMFDTHQVVRADGVWSESYQPGSYSLGGLEERAREELFALFPELRSDPVAYGQSARPSVTRAQAALLAA